MKKYKVGLLYDSFNNNIGDIAMGTAMAQALSGYEDIKTEIINPFQFNKEDYDKIIIGGGQLLRKEGDRYYDIFRLKGNHILNAVGLSQPVDKLEYLKQYSYVSTRTIEESNVVRETISEVQTIPCMTTIIKHDHYKIADLEEGEIVVGIHAVPYTLQLCPDFVNIINKIPHKKVLIPFTLYNKDKSFLESLPFDWNTTTILDDTLGPLELHSVISQMSYVVVSSLHASIFAYSQNIPFLSLGQPKVVSYFKDRELDKYIFTSDIAFRRGLKKLESNWQQIDMSTQITKDKSTLESTISNYIKIIRSSEPKNVPTHKLDLKEQTHVEAESRHMNEMLSGHVIEARDRLIGQLYGERNANARLLSKQIKNLKLANKDANVVINQLVQSKEYRLGAKLLHPLRAVRTATGKAKVSLHDIAAYQLREAIGKKYFIGDIPTLEHTSEAAVVLHMYHLDNWPLFKEKLVELGKTLKYNLIVTMPEKNTGFSSTITETFSDAKIFIVPNRGRDVLPFIMVSQLLYKSGYSYVLKVHSKKSTHRNDGQLWLEDMLDNLIPSKKLLNNLVGVLNKADTAVVGPEGYYYPLSVNFPANGVHIQRVIRLSKGNRSKARSIYKDRNAYGFFGGTMFWMRLDAVEQLLRYTESFFERESGQIDGTFAHALERMFCVVPELNHKKLYEISRDQLREREYKTDNVPDWSEDHLK